MIEFYTRETIDQLEWPKGSEGEFAKNYLLPLIKEGPTTFIANAKTQLHLIKLGEKIIPITQNEEEYENSYLLSTYFFIAHLKEKGGLLTPLVHLLGLLLKRLKINQVIIINNWLITTNPYPDLSEEELSLLVGFLQKKFPAHYFMIRSINTYKNDHSYQTLKKTGFRLLFSRFVFLYDPEMKKELTQSMVRKQKKDFNKIARQNYTVEEVIKPPSEKEKAHLLALYEQVYFSKYTRYSPQYTSQFLDLLIRNKTMRLKLLKKEGEIYGVAGFLQKGGYLLTNFFGYDTQVPQEEGLYRMLSGMIMEEIHQSSLLAHQGSGAADFKLWRGFLQQPEYIAIFDRHLPLYKRLFWSLAALTKGKAPSPSKKPPLPEEKD